MKSAYGKGIVNVQRKGILNGGSSYCKTTRTTTFEHKEQMLLGSTKCYDFVLQIGEVINGKSFSSQVHAQLVAVCFS